MGKEAVDVGLVDSEGGIEEEALEKLNQLIVERQKPSKGGPMDNDTIYPPCRWK